MKSFQHHRILLGLTGSIAAYKAVELTRLFKDAGAEVQVVMTRSAEQFVTPLTLQAVSARPVRLHLFDQEAEAAMSHIELARWATSIVIAPASADILAKLAHGFADDLLTTLCLASRAPLYLAPAMNRVMWEHEATQSNLMILKNRGATLLGPAEGLQACGESGFGRMLEPAEIVHEMMHSVRSEVGSLQDQHVVITAGPTREALDPVRYLSNQSSGKMGYSLAKAAQKMGARVTLISGPVYLKSLEGVRLVVVESAQEMLEAVMQTIEDCSLFIAAAAVADYRPMDYVAHKIKKSDDALTLTLVKNPDILAQVAALPQNKRPHIVMGFAAETNDCIPQGRLKLKNKKVDVMAVNDVSRSDIGFHSDQNAVTLLFCDGREQELPKALKDDLASVILKEIHAWRTHCTMNEKGASDEAIDTSQNS
jgi:phosphopantothenoylcysteine decarboxylase/phosphopantothenate--cysteine ligase